MIYVIIFFDFVHKVSFDLAMYAIRPSGGLMSTASDMIKWENIIRERKIILKYCHPTNFKKVI